MLLENPWSLTRSRRSKLAEVQRTNRRLYRAYLLKETLARALDYLQPWRAERSLKERLAWASRSQLQPFVKAARTIRKHLPGILAYVRARLTNGLVEGPDAKVRMITRRAFGFHSHKALIRMVFLGCVSTDDGQTHSYFAHLHTQIPQQVDTRSRCTTHRRSRDR